jgi:hypothetical protein
LQTRRALSFDLVPSLASINLNVSTGNQSIGSDFCCYIFLTVVRKRRHKKKKKENNQIMDRYSSSKEIPKVEIVPRKPDEKDFQWSLKYVVFSLFIPNYLTGLLGGIGGCLIVYLKNKK